MNATIQVLSGTLASQIAAGEVVERPASVVKELVENSLDAGASRCEIAIKAGGVTGISVVDDGSGMSEVDARLCLERHATSKLKHFEDLHRISSYGFRGEALPSIASVSRFRLRTRTRDAEAGVEVTTEAGAPASYAPIGVAAGTAIEVNDLFFNVPARRKFLRSTGTESGHVTETVELAALARPDVSFTVLRDGRRARQWLRAASRHERVQQVLGEEELAACVGERGPLSVEAYLSSPERARQGAQGLRVLVNNRPIRHRALAASIAHAYGSVLERGRYPRGVVFLDLPPALLDINVHPQKAEVRFADPRAVTDAVHSIVSRSLAEKFSLLRPERPTWQRGTGWTQERPTSAAPPLPSSRPSVSEPPAPNEASSGTTPSPLRRPAPSNTSGGAVPNVMPNAVKNAVPGASRSAPLSTPLPGRAALAAAALLEVGETPPATRATSTQWSALKFLAQVRQTYLICEGPEGICVLDQHAAAERVMFAKLKREYQTRQVASQALLFPVTLQLSAEETELFEARSDSIRAMGLEVRVRGRDMVSVHGVPKLLQTGSAERLLRDLLGELARSTSRGFSDAIDKALATMACHAAVRAGDPIDRSQAEALLEALEGIDFAGYCPHGRPIVAFLSWAELERRVGRR